MDKNVIIDGEASETDSDEDVQLNSESTVCHCLLFCFNCY